MIMVIFGAGASYDSTPSRRPSEYPRPQTPYRPPLAKELFLASQIFGECLARFPQCYPIIPYLQATSSEGGNIEHSLEILQSEAEADPERKRQLAAIRFYLQLLIWECESYWPDASYGVTNYKLCLINCDDWTIRCY